MDSGMDDVEAVVLVGGKGTRLRPLTLSAPKPMLPTAGVPFLAHLLSRVRAAGVRRAVLGTSYLAETFAEHFGDGSELGLELVYVTEDEPLGTGGGIRNVAGHLSAKHVLVFNGDVLAGTIAAVSPGVIRMPWAPAVTMFSMAVTWLALSASNCPEAVRSWAPAASAAAWAPSFILTKNGLDSVFVISPTMISSSWADASCGVPANSGANAPAIMPTVSAARTTVRRTRRRDIKLFSMLPP